MITATAWAIVENGKLNVNTVHGRAPVSAMVNWLCTEHDMMLTRNWSDEMIQKQFNEVVARRRSDAKVVRVRVEMIEGT